MAPGVVAASACERVAAVDGGREEAAASEQRQWYRLVKVPEASSGGSEGCVAFTAATEEDAETLAGLLTPQQALAARSPALSVEEPDSPEQSGSTSRPAAAAKPGGPCDHCGTSESPQWRRGPPSKQMLCNACGTRYRRTGALGVPMASRPVSSASTSPASKLRVVPEAPAKRARLGLDECVVYALPPRV